MFMNWNNFSVNVTSTCSANLYDISRWKPSKARAPKTKIRLWCNCACF